MLAGFDLDWDDIRSDLKHEINLRRCNFAPSALTHRAQNITIQLELMKNTDIAPCIMISAAPKMICEE